MDASLLAEEITKAKKKIFLVSLSTMMYNRNKAENHVYVCVWEWKSKKTRRYWKYMYKRLSKVMAI